MKIPVMIGPSPNARGGMASVIAIYRDAGLFAPGTCRFIPTADDGSLPWKLWIAAIGLARFFVLCASGNVSVLHVHGASRKSFWRKLVFMRIALARSIPVIFHLHGGEFRQFVEQLDQKDRGRLLEALRKCSLILALNDEVASWMRSLVPGQQIEVMPNPVDLDRFPVSTAQRERSVLYLGRLEIEKGVMDLLDAFASVRNRDPQVKLLLCGTGNAAATLQDEVTKRHLGGAVEFPGWVSGSTKLSMLGSAGVFALPSYAEGMPISVLEAMASGTPVVATRVGGVPAMLDDGAGYLVDVGCTEQLASALLMALDPQNSSAVVEKALARVRETYAATRVVARLVNLYRGLTR